MVSISQGQLVKVRNPLDNRTDVEKHVVRAIISADVGVLLLEKRYPDATFLELPGGNIEKVKKDGRIVWLETPWNALVEKTDEETRLKIVSGTYLCSVEYTSKLGLNAVQDFWVVSVNGHESARHAPDEHDGLLWLPHWENLRPDIKEKSAMGIVEYRKTVSDSLRD